MALSPISVGDTGAQARAKINAGFTATDAATTGLAAEAIARSAEINLAGVLDESRPGERPEFWTDATSGAPSALASLSGSVTRQDGAAIAVTGSGTRAPRWVLRLEPGRLYRLRYVVRRTTNTPDPANDAVNLSVQWMTSAKAAISTTTLASLTDLTTGSGRVEYVFNISTASGSEVDAVAPNGTIYARPYVQTFGLLCVTDIEVIQAIDITEWGVYPGGDLTSLDNRVDALESIDAGDRLDVIESAIDGTKVQTFATYADAVGATLLATTEVVKTYGYSEVGDGGGGEYTISDTEPTHEGKIEFASGKWGELSNAVIKFRMLGAAADGTTDDTTAVTNALAIGRPIEGDWLTHAVSGNITLPANTDISRAGFKQLTPNNSSRRTLYSNGVDKVRLVDVWVDRNGDGAGGGLATAAGIWIGTGSDHYLERVEVFGSDMGNGIVFTGSSNFKLINPYVHDITYNLATDPGDDRVQGIWLNNGCNNFTVIAPRSEDLGGTVGVGSFDTKYSRGIAIDGASNSFTILGGSVKRCDQGLDITGSGGCYDFRVIGMMAEDCQYWGFKVANYNRYGTFIACHAIRSGSGGFVISGGAGSESRGITYIGCRARDTGYRTTERGAVAPAGFWVQGGPAGTPDFPRGVKFIGCDATDDQEVKTQMFGFRDETVYGGLQPNEAINCTVSGVAEGGSEFYQLHVPAVFVNQNPGASIPNATWTPVEFTADVFDTMSMHDGSSNLEVITIGASGYYKIEAQVGFSANSTGGRFARAVFGGAPVYSSAVSAPGSSAAPTILKVNHFAWCPSGTEIYIEVYQESGGSLSLRAVETNLVVYKAMPNG